MPSLHVEATSRCTLACPRCERTDLINRFKKFEVQDLDVDAFINFIDVPVDKINFCGNLGDPIYHRDFLRLFELAQTKAKSITMTTNGSRKSRTWWKSLNKLFRDTDNITFSIDGLPENFTQYRINGDWDSILPGIEECVKGPASTEWKCIAFNYNEHCLDQIGKLANDLGFDKFLLEESDRWLNSDPYKPSKFFTDKPTSSVEIVEHCIDRDMHFIGADGQYAPCCYSKHFNFYYKNAWWKNRDKHSIYTTKLSEQLRYFEEFYSTIQTERYDYCVYNCGKC